MSENHFSVDDILNEYSKKREELKKKKASFDVDEFLNEAHYSKKSTTYNKVSPTNISKDNLDSFIPPKKTTQDSQRNKNDKVNSPVTKKQTLGSNMKLKKEKQFDTNSPQGFGFNKNSYADIKPIKKSSGNTEIINNLLKLKRERILNNTSELIPVTKKNIKDIDLDIEDKIIPKTQQITLPENATEEEKEAYLAKQRSKKIKDFVLQEIIEDIPEEEEPEEEPIVDYNSIEDVPAIHKSITQLKSTLMIRFAFLLVTLLVSGYIVIANEQGLPIMKILSRAKSPISYLFVVTIIGLLAAFSSYTVIASGLKNLFTLKADSDSLSAIAIMSSLISSTAMLSNTDLLQRQKLHIYIPVAIGVLLFNTIGKLLIVNRTLRNFNFVSGEGDKFAIFKIENERLATKFTKGALTDFPSLASIKKTEFVKNFLKNSYCDDVSERYCRYAVPITFLVSLLVAILSVIFTKENTDTIGFIYIALANFTGTIALCCTFALTLVINIPLSKASKRYLEGSAALLGYSSVDEFKDTNSILIDTSLLFPEGAVDFVSLKQLSSTTIEEGILIAASLASHANSILKAPFYKMLKGKTEMLYSVDSYVYEDSLGISGWIENKRVLLGSRELMENHSIEGLPSKAKERRYARANGNVVYLSVSGEVTTLFIVKARASLGVSRWLKELEKLNVTVVMHCVDSFISLNYLSELFDVSPECFKLLPFRYHKDFDEQTTYVPKIDSSLLCSGRFQSLAMVVSGAKRLYKTAIFGVGSMLISAATGGVIALVMALLSSFTQLNCSTVMLYNLIWLAITLSIEAYRKI